MVVWRIRLKKNSQPTRTEGVWFTAVLNPRREEIKNGLSVVKPPHTVTGLQKAFTENRVAGVLQEAVQEIASTQEVYEGRRVIRIRLKYADKPFVVERSDVWSPREAVDLCLAELGIGLLEEM